MMVRTSCRMAPPGSLAVIVMTLGPSRNVTGTTSTAGLGGQSAAHPETAVPRVEGHGEGAAQRLIGVQRDADPRGELGDEADHHPVFREVERGRHRTGVLLGEAVARLDLPPA